MRERIQREHDVPERQSGSAALEERAVAEHNYEWFSKWIWGESVPNGMLEIESAESR